MSLTGRELWSRIYAFVSFVIGQVPSVLVVFDLPYRLSLYHPGIYRGLQSFLLLPVMVGFFATWLVMRSHRAMYVIFACFVILIAIIFYIYRWIDLSSEAHPVNWILFYCAFALLIAALSRFVAEQIGLAEA
jgi:hypothetical protein